MNGWKAGRESVSESVLQLRKLTAPIRVVEIVAEPGYDTPLHIHEIEDEHFIVLEGTAQIVSGHETFEATAGDRSLCARAFPTRGVINPNRQSVSW